MTMPTVALDVPSAHVLADQASIIQDLQFVMDSCKRLLTELAKPEEDRDPLIPLALWSSAVMAYGRCFSKGKRFGLATEDVRNLPLHGAVMKFHKWIIEERDKLTAHAPNPSEAAKVGAALSPPEQKDRRVEGIVIFASSHVVINDVGVRQLGGLASELAKQTAEKAQEQQDVVLKDAQQLNLDGLYRLPPIGTWPPGEDNAEGSSLSIGASLSPTMRIFIRILNGCLARAGNPVRYRLRIIPVATYRSSVSRPRTPASLGVEAMPGCWASKVTGTGARPTSRAALRAVPGEYPLATTFPSCTATHSSCAVPTPGNGCSATSTKLRIDAFGRVLRHQNRYWTTIRMPSGVATGTGFTSRPVRKPIRIDASRRTSTATARLAASLPYVLAATSGQMVSSRQHVVVSADGIARGQRQCGFALQKLQDVAGGYRRSRHAAEDLGGGRDGRELTVHRVAVRQYPH